MSGQRAGTPGSPAPERTSGSRPPSLTVRALLGETNLGVSLSLVAGAAGLDRAILHARIQKSGLALVGHFHGIVSSRVQILGQTELSYLARLSVEERRGALSGFFSMQLSCVIVTGGARPPRSSDPARAADSAEGFALVPELRDCAEEASTPLLLSSERSSVTITALHALLDDRLAPRVRLHGVLVDVFGVGLLLKGESSIGKSECALDLVMRGHRLVADDVVECDFRPPSMVFGEPADMLRHHLEVRGLGILDVKELFGVAAIRERKRIDVVVRLAEWSDETEYDRLGLDERHHLILGVPIPELVIPVRPGRDIASILEVAARNELLKNAGHHAAREFFDSHAGALMSERADPAVERARSKLPAPASDESATPPPVRQGSPTPTKHGSPSQGLYGSMPRAPESSMSLPKPRR